MLANKTILFVDQSSPDFCRSHFFQILDIWCRSGDIRDQSRKLSKIELNFGRFFVLSNFSGPVFQKLYTCYDLCLAARRIIVWKMFCGDTPTSPEVIMANTLNFKPNYNFSPLFILFFFGGGTPSQLGYALGSLGQSLARVKKLRGQHPEGRDVVSPEKYTWVAQC